MSSAFLFVRLALATGLVLAPGAMVARAAGVRGASATLAWGLGLVFGALGVVFAVHASLGLALVLLGAAAVVAAPFAFRRPAVPPIPRRGAVWVAGVILGLLLWHVAGEIGGDGLFHLARARKLLDLGDLSLASVDEFADGGLHPGYAFPLWHGFLALVAKVGFMDPAEVVLHGPTVLAPLAVVAAYEAGYALFRRVTAAAASAAASVAMVAMAPGHGGAYTALALPATAARQLLVPAALALALAAMRRPSPGLLASAGVASLVLAVVHPTYAIFLWIPFGGFLLVRWAWRQGDVREGMLVLASLVVPATLYLVWLVPVIRSTASVSPGAAERERAFAQYAGQLHGSVDHFSLAPQIFGRSGAVAVAALLLLPLTALASRRRWAAYVVGWVARRLRDHSRALDLHPVFGRGLALAGPAPRGLPTARLRPRRRHGRRRLAARPARGAARARRPAWSCSGSSRATSATPSSRAVPRGRRGSRSSARSSRSSSGCGGCALSR